MYGLGDVSVKAKRLMDVTYEAMMAINTVRPGASLGDVASPFNSMPKLTDWQLSRFCGHGLGRVSQHANIRGRPGEGLVMREGMFFLSRCESGQTGGENSGRRMDCGTRDRTLSAYEHSVGVTAGVEIFTKSLGGLDTPTFRTLSRRKIVGQEKQKHPFIQDTTRIGHRKKLRGACVVAGMQ